MSKMMRFDLEGDLNSILGPLINIWNGLVYLVHQSAKDYLKVIDPMSRALGEIPLVGEISNIVENIVFR
jgi:hypothetical protein